MKSLHLSRPHAIMMVGIPGSGKSFFARQFSDTFHTPYIDYNDIGSRALDGGASGELTLLFLREIAKTGQTFLFEGSSDTRTNRTEFAKWARAHGYTPLFVWTQTDPATSLKRTLKAKHISRDDFATIIRDFSPPHPDEKPVVISGKHTYASQARTVLAHLGADNRPKQPAPTRQPGPIPPKRNVIIR
jgi:predicted kinase